MGPKLRAIAPKRKKVESSSDSSDDEILDAKDLQFVLEKDESASDADPDEPDSIVRIKNVRNYDTPPTSALTDVIRTGHICVMSGVAEIHGASSSQNCTARKPMKMTIKEIVSHYYLHYKERGIWDDVVPVPTQDQLAKIDSYQCKLCEQKFRSRVVNDPAPARSSFLYHYATFHGKIIDAMQQDTEVDMKDVLELLKTFNPDIRKFIIDGTETTHDDSPCHVRESFDWKVKLQVSHSVPLSRSNNPLACPKQNLPTCKDLDRNKDINTLKLHLFYHYLDYWKDSVPVCISSEVKCGDCNKRVTAETAEACRTSMICHRAIIHGELKMAIEEDDEEFNEELFQYLFNPKQNQPPKVLFSKGVQPLQSSNLNSGTANRAPDSNPVPSKPDKPKPKPGNKSSNPRTGRKSPHQVPVNEDSEMRKKKSGRTAGTVRKIEKKGHADSDLSSDEEVLIPTQPYARKRIKQNLSNIDFDEDSDKDGDWEKKEKKRVAASKILPRSLPKRRVRPTTSFAGNPDESD